MKLVIKITILLFTIELCLQVFAYCKSVYYYNKQLINNKFLVNWYSKNQRNAWWFKDESLKLIPDYHPFLTFFFHNIHLSNINIDSSGARYTKNNPPPNTGIYKKIFMFGGSAMFGYAVKNGETIPSYISKNLNTPTNQYTVVNFGQVGYNSNQELLYFILQLKNGNIPNMAVFYDGCNDLTYAKSSQDYHLDTIAGEPVFAKQMGSLRSSFTFNPEKDDVNTSLINVTTLQRIVNFIISDVKLIHYPVQLISDAVKYVRHDQPIEQELSLRAMEENVNHMVVNYGENANMIESLSQQYHFKYILLWQPFGLNKKLTKQEFSDTEIETVPGNRVLIASASAALKQLSINHFVNLSNVFDNYSNTSIFYDYCHITNYGNSIVADKITDLIKSEMAEAQ